MSRPTMASAVNKPPFRSSSSSPITLADSSISSPSPPNPNKIQSSSLLNPQHSGTSRYNIQHQENDAIWQVPRAYTTELIRFVENLFRTHPVLNTVAERHPCLVGKIVRSIQSQVHWELNRDPQLDWVQRAESLFNYMAATVFIHPLVACAFNIPYQPPPNDDIPPNFLPLRQELSGYILGWVDARNDPLLLLPRMLSWLHFSKRDLSAREFQQAMMFSLFDNQPQQGIMPTFQELNSIGGGFIHFLEGRGEVMVPDSLKHSLRDFFSNFEDDYSRYHANMGLACLAYIHFAVGFDGPCPDDISLDQRLRRFPLLPYAVENWHYNVPSTIAFMERCTMYLYDDMIIKSMMQVQGEIPFQYPPDGIITQETRQWYRWNTTRLSYAASIGSYPLVVAFLNRGCDPNENIGLQPPIVSAAMRGRSDLVHLLANRGANVNVANFVGRTALFSAVSRNDIELVDYLLSAHADLNLNCQMKDGITPLMAAICNGNVQLAEKLLYAGAKVYVQACDGQTALSYALMKPEFLDLVFQMFAVASTGEYWKSKVEADITLYEALIEIKNPMVCARVNACLRQVEEAVRTRGSQKDLEAWSLSFVRKALDKITARCDLAALAADVAKKRRGHGMISALSNVFRRRYMLDGRVGKGGFSSAWKAIDLVTGRLVAVKFLLNPEITVNRDDAFKELKFMSETNHPNILKCLDTMTIQGDPVIVTEFAQGGDLWHYLASGFPYGVSNDIAKRMFRQIMEGLGYLHSKDVVHRDLKPLNILVFENNHVKLADFGHSTQIPADHHGYVPHVPCTPTHVAPEAIRDEQAIRDWILAKPCDVWSAGVCLYELLAGKEPFHILTGDDGHKGLHRRIRRGDFQFDDQALWGGREDLAMHLIARMMNPDPHKRPTAEQVLTHPWLAGDLTRQGMLDFVGLRVPHAQKPESFNSQGPEWIAPFPRIRLRAPWIEGLEEFPPLSRQRRADGSFSEELEEFQLTEVDWSAPAPGYRL